MSSTTYAGTPSPAARVASCTTTATAPLLTASARKSCASNFSPLSATKQSPAPTFRVSVAMRAIAVVPRGPSPSASAIRSSVQKRGCSSERALGLVGGFGRRAGLLGLVEHPHVLDRDHRLIGEGADQADLPLVERQLGRAADLVGLVTLAGEQHEIVRRRDLERAGDRVATVFDPLVRYSAHPRLDVVEDALRVFGPRVVARDDGEVRALRGDLSHERPLAAIAIAAAAKHHDEPASGERPDRVDGARQRVGRVRVVAEHRGL